MALTPNEHPYNGEIRDADGRLIVVGPDGVGISGGTGGSTGGLTDAQLRATPVPVSGSFGTPDVTDRAARLLGHVTVDSMPSTAVTGPLTDAQLRAGAVPVSLASAPTTPITAAALPLPAGAATETTLAAVAKDATLTTNLGAVADAEAAAGNGSTISLLKRLRTLLNGGLPAALAANGGLKVEGVAGGVAQPVSLATAPTTPVTGPLTDTQLRASAVPVSGTFFQATQPVSLATNTPDVTDRAARLLGHVTVDSMPSTAVTGPLTDTQLRATAVPVSLATAPTTPVTGPLTDTQLRASAVPVSMATQTPDVTDRAARVLGVVTQPPTSLAVTATAATGVAATATLPAAAGLFHYITLIEIQLYATALRTGGATPVLVTTTNLPGSPVWDFDTAQAIGATIRQASQFVTPLKSSVVNTATTIVAPIATTGIWRINVYYYTAA